MLVHHSFEDQFTAEYNNKKEAQIGSQWCNWIFPLDYVKTSLNFKTASMQLQ